MRVDLLRQAALFTVTLTFTACSNPPPRSADPRDLAAAPADGGEPDASAPADLAIPADVGTSLDLATHDLGPTDAAVAHDLATPPDLATPRDFTLPPDLTAPPDLTPPPDLAGPPDMTPPSGYSSSNPIQVPLGSIFNVDTVANSATNGQSYPPLVSMDGSGYDFLTESVAEANFDDGAGLPSDGYFPSDADHPNAQLAFNDSGTGPNSVILNAPPSPVLSVTFPLTATPLGALQLYLTSTEGQSSVTVTLNYSDGSSTPASFTVPDWFNSSQAVSPVFVVQSGLSRFSMLGGDDFREGAALYGASVVVNSAKALASVTVGTTASGGRLVLYGATAY